MYTFDNLKNLVQGLFSEDYWVYYLVYCLVVPFFVLLFYVSMPVFNSIDFLKLLVIAVAFNIGLLIFLGIFSSLIAIHQEKYNKRLIDSLIQKLSGKITKNLGADLSSEKIQLLMNEKKLGQELAIAVKESAKATITGINECNDLYHQLNVANRSIKPLHILALESVFLTEVVFCSSTFLSMILFKIFGLEYNVVEKIRHFLFAYLPIYIIYVASSITFYKYRGIK